LEIFIGAFDTFWAPLVVGATSTTLGGSGESFVVTATKVETTSFDTEVAVGAVSTT
jgi:hypothetical protein